jgi:hypothetical protein
MGLITWLRSFLRHSVRGGESLIAMESKGEEVIHKEEWSALPPEEREKWEPTDESTILWRRKPS